MPDEPQVTPLPEPQDYRQKGRLHGKIAVVTGSDSGIGQATAIEFAKEGADVVVTYLHDHAGAEHTRAQVEAQGQRALVVHLDQTQESSVAQLFERAVSELGTPFVLVNDAGEDSTGKEVADVSSAEWEHKLRVNLLGPFYCCQHFIRLRRNAGGQGKIINITSVHQEIPRAGASAYDASKGALRNLTRTLALELAPDLINVNNIAPGMVLTPFNQAALDDPKVYAEQVQSIPFKRAAQPWEIARLALYLASSDADYATGTTFTLDGGLMQNTGQGA